MIAVGPKTTISCFACSQPVSNSRTIRPYGVRHFALAASMIAVVLFGGIVVSDLSTDVGTSILPPYFDAKELPPIKTELTP